ncbi:MAG: hypothetical protein ACW99A_22400, partial [Candidatus Kariarchaeaceae archaeon]
MDGVTWFEIVNSIKTSTYNWITHPLDSGTNYRVRVIVSGTYLGYSLNTAMDVSEGSFTIDPDHDSPMISAPEDLTFENNTVGHILTWTLTDDNPLNYSILQNGIYVIGDQPWL